MEQPIHIETREGAKSIASHYFSIDATVTIGRNDTNDITLVSKEISRKHATLTFCERGFKITDHSLNGIETLTQRSGEWITYGSRCQLSTFTVIVNLRRPSERHSDDGSVRQRALERLIDELHLSVVKEKADDLSHRVESALDRILFEYGIDEKTRPALRCALRDEALGLGPLEQLLEDNSVSEIMVVSPNNIYVERNGQIQKTAQVFSSESSVRTVIDRIIAPLGRRIDESSPMVDARLQDGSRVNAVIPPLAISGSSLTIRKFSKNTLSIDALVSFGSLNEDMARFLCQAVEARQNIIISGGTGSGKTTLLNILSAQIANEERIVTIEDAAELQLNQPHVVSLEAKPTNSEGRGEVTIRQLVKNSLRMRPDRIIIGECRGSEALDMLQAMNTGHDGSLTTTHANSPDEAIMRLETLALMAGLDLPAKAIREQIAGAVDLIVQQKRFGDGQRRITAISEVNKVDEHDRVKTTDIWRVEKNTHTGQFTFQSTGWLPKFQLRGGTL